MRALPDGMGSDPPTWQAAEEKRAKRAHCPRVLLEREDHQERHLAPSKGLRQQRFASVKDSRHTMSIPRHIAYRQGCQVVKLLVGPELEE